MSFQEFDKSRIEAYQKLAREAWGETDAYKEYEAKSATRSDTDERHNTEGLMNVFFEFGTMKDRDPGDPTVQAQVKKLQDFITEHYYTCTKQILAGLGEMYTGGGEMTANINAAGGQGCAAFAAEAIKIYCKRKQ